MSSKLPIVCWGCGEYGDIFVDYMEKYGYDEYFSIEYFLDKCPTKKFRSYKCFFLCKNSKISLCEMLFSRYICIVILPARAGVHREF